MKKKITYLYLFHQNANIIYVCGMIMLNCTLQLLFIDPEPLVARLKTSRKVLTSAMRHGLACEATAALAYVQVNNVPTTLNS